MSDTYRLFALKPVYVQGKGEVAPVGHVSDAQREMMEAAQRAEGAGNTHGSLGGIQTPPAPPKTLGQRKRGETFARTPRDARTGPFPSTLHQPTGDPLAGLW
ncbi:hypothetical protein EV658_10558 [Phaeovulum veldkampii DSM 11550]|nr:hypothetical protein EV658_10558 [Phaeovulum veldkampii DSM 11550]